MLYFYIEIMIAFILLNIFIDGTKQVWLGLVRLDFEENKQ